MGVLFNQLQDFYKSISWNMQQVPDETILSITFAGQKGSFVFVASVDEELVILTMFARYPNDCPAEKRNEVNRFLTRLNFGLGHGAWVIDLEDGEIRFRMGIDLNELELTGEYMRQITHHTVLTMDTFIPALDAIIKEGKTAEQAHDMIFN